MRSTGAWARLLIGLGISAVFVWLIARSVDPRALADALSKADLRVLPLAIALYFVGVWIRSVRWGLLLGGGVPAGKLFQALVVGFTVNNLLPARLGELARAYLLARWCQVPYGRTLASVVAERVLDGLALAALLLTALAFVPAPPYLLGAGLVIAAGFGVGALLLAAASWRSGSIEWAAERVARFLPSRIGHGVVRLGAGFAHGIGVIRGWLLLGQLAILSLLGWLFELGLFFVLMIGFPMVASLPAAILAGTAANFATLVPSSPGYVGTFDGVLVRVLSDVMHTSPGEATAYALVVHAALYMPVVLLGLVILWRSDITLSQVTHLTRTRGTPEVASSSHAPDPASPTA